MKKTLLLFLPLLVACDKDFMRSDVFEPSVQAPAPSPPPPHGTVVSPAVEPPAPTGAPTPGPAFVAVVDHEYFPLIPGRTLIYEGDDEGAFRRDEVTVLEDTDLIEGTACTAVRQHVYLDGLLSEITTEWYAQDSLGNVWKFGEESLEHDGAAFVVSEDSWISGRDGAYATIVFGAEPLVGDQFTAFAPDGLETLNVLSLDTTALVPFGTFPNSLELEETDDDDEEDDDILLYAPGVGLVSESHSEGKIVLVAQR